LEKLGIIMKKPEKPPLVEDKPSYGEIMDELIQKRKFADFFRIEDTEYPYWEQWKYKSKGWGISPEKIWSCAKSHRRGQKKIHFSEIPGFTFSFNSPSIIQKYLHQLDLNLGGTLQSESLIPAQEKDRYLVNSLMEEAIASSQIEGAVTTRKVAKEMLEKSQRPKNKSEQMILNNYNIMKWVVENKNTDMSLDFLLHLHKIITAETLHDADDEGSLRKNDDIKILDETNEIFYTPPEEKYLTELIKSFISFANDKNQDHVFIHPIVKGIILHFLIGYIHPFVDGNGRTARAIFYWYLLRKGYWLIEYMSVSRIILKAKAKYARAYLFTEYDNNDLTYFILYNIKSVSVALEEMKLYIQNKAEEKKQVLSLIKNTDFNERQIVFIKDILQDKTEYFTVKQIEQRFNVSNQTARNDLNNMIKKGILIPKITGRIVRFFASPDFEKQLKIVK
jgi:Fic family protein